MPDDDEILAAWRRGDYTVTEIDDEIRKQVMAALDATEERRQIMLRKEPRPQSSNGGISMGGILFVIFLSLRLTDVDHWSWWWVTAPLWMPWAIAPRALFLGITRRA